MTARPINYLFVKSELGAGTWGASLGIEALQIAARAHESDVLDRYPSHQIKHAFADREVPVWAKNIGSIVKVYYKIADYIQWMIREQEAFPFVITGDHANAAGTIAGLKIAYPGKRLGVVWIDAHADIHTPWTSPSGNMHGMPVALSLNLRKDHRGTNKVSPTTEKFWNEACELGGIAPKILPQDLVFIGIRDLENEEWDIIQQLGIRYYTPMDLTELGTHRIVDETLAHLTDCDIIYVTFDVDSLESELIMGTGTPVPGGLSVPQAVSILKRFWQEPRLVGLEVTEVNPLLDNQNRTAEIVSRVIEEVVGTPGPKIVDAG
jgi:arginase